MMFASAAPHSERHHVFIIKQKKLIFSRIIPSEMDFIDLAQMTTDESLVAKILVKRTPKSDKPEVMRNMFDDYISNAHLDNHPTDPQRVRLIVRIKFDLDKNGTPKWYVDDKSGGIRYPTVSTYKDIQWYSDRSAGVPTCHRVTSVHRGMQTGEAKSHYFVGIDLEKLLFIPYEHLESKYRDLLKSRDTAQNFEVFDGDGKPINIGKIPDVFTKEEIDAAVEKFSARIRKVKPVRVPYSEKYRQFAGKEYVRPEHDMIDDVKAMLYAVQTEYKEFSHESDMETFKIENAKENIKAILMQLLSLQQRADMKGVFYLEMRDYQQYDGTDSGLMLYPVKYTEDGKLDCHDYNELDSLQQNKVMASRNLFAVDEEYIAHFGEFTGAAQKVCKMIVCLVHKDKCCYTSGLCFGTCKKDCCYKKDCANAPSEHDLMLEDWTTDAVKAVQFDPTSRFVRETFRTDAGQYVPMNQIYNTLIVDMDPKFIDDVIKRYVNPEDAEQEQIKVFHKTLEKMTFMRAVENGFLKYRHKILRPLRKARSDALLAVTNPLDRTPENISAFDDATIKYMSTKDMLDSWMLTIQIGAASKEFIEFVKRVHFQRIARSKLKKMYDEVNKSWKLLHPEIVEEKIVRTAEEIAKSYEIPIQKKKNGKARKAKKSGRKNKK